MSKKFLKFAFGVATVAVAGKVALSKFKKTKEEFEREENDSLGDEIKKYNAIGSKKIIEIEDEEFSGCELKTVGAKTVLDLGLAIFEKDVYINFTSTASNLTIVLPEGINVVCDISNKASSVKNYVENIDEEGIFTVYIIGKATASSVDIVPVDFYIDDEDFEDSDFIDEELDDSVIFDETEDDVEVEVKVINETVKDAKEETVELEEVK